MYPPFRTLTLKKYPKCTEMVPKYTQILWWPPKNIHKIFIAQKYSFFWKTTKNIEIQNFEPQTLAWAYVCIKISDTLLPGVYFMTSITILETTLSHQSKAPHLNRYEPISRNPESAPEVDIPK